MSESNAEDSALGMEVFYSSTIGLGGKLKTKPEDFIVDEISIHPERVENGNYTIVRIRSTNWETNKLVRQISRNLHISRKRVSFAGSKDKRAVTTQLMSIHEPLENVRILSIKDVEILDMYSSGRGLDLGELIGNRFEITIKNITVQKDKAKDTIDKLVTEFTKLGGFPNFFGVQRFGAVRPNTHLIGKEIVHGNFETAVMCYLAKPEKNEEPDAFVARKKLDETHDFSLALKMYPKNLIFELAMINHLSAHTNDYVGALKTLPKNLLMLFIHAYQSYLFNRILSQRIKMGIPLHSPIEGDIILPSDKDGLPDCNLFIPVTANNLKKIEEKVLEGKAFVSGLVFGSESNFSGGIMGEIEKKVIDEEGLTGQEFIIPKIKEISSKGTRRDLVSPLKDFSYKFIDEQTINMKFTLNKGCYATSLLREFMKTNLMAY